MRPIINSEKRIVQQTLGNVPTATVGTILIASCVQDPIATSPTQIRPGTAVKAVYVELWILGSGAQVATSTAILYKLSSGGADPDSTEMGNLNAWANKKNILESHQGINGDNNSNPIPVFRNWIKIPKGKQRFGLGDNLKIAIKSITDEVEFCGLFIFKAYN